MEQSENYLTTDAPQCVIDKMARLLAKTMGNKAEHSCMVKSIVAAYGQYNYCRVCRAMLDIMDAQQGKEASHENN